MFAPDVPGEVMFVCTAESHSCDDDGRDPSRTFVVSAGAAVVFLKSRREEGGW